MPASSHQLALKTSFVRQFQNKSKWCNTQWFLCLLRTMCLKASTQQNNVIYKPLKCRAAAPLPVFSVIWEEWRYRNLLRSYSSIKQLHQGYSFLKPNLIQASKKLKPDGDNIFNFSATQS